MLNRNVIPNSESLQHDENVSEWMPKDFGDQIFGNTVQKARIEAKSSRSAQNDTTRIEKERERLTDIFSPQKTEAEIYERLMMHLSVLTGKDKYDVSTWEPTTISYLPYEIEIEEVEEPVLIQRVELETEWEEERIAEEEFQHLRKEAERILEEARIEADRLVSNALNQIDQIRGQAYQEAYEQAKYEAKSILDTAKSVVDETHKWREEVLQKSEESIINLVQLISSKMFGDGFVLEPEFVEKMVVRAISESSRLGNVRVYMNPLDEEKLVSLWHESDLKVNGQKIQLVSSPNIDPGGCFVEGEFGSVDSRIGMQLELIQSEIRQLLFSREDLT